MDGLIMEIEENNIYLGDSYELIKSVKDKSVDLIYTDIPYLIGTGGSGQSALSQRIVKEHFELGNEHCKKTIENNIAKFEKLMSEAKDKVEYEKYRVQMNVEKNKLNLHQANIVNGIDYSILDEFVRVMKKIYIYIYGVVRSKC